MITKSGGETFYMYTSKTSDNVPDALNRLVYVFCGILILALLLIHENPEIKIN